MPVSVGFTLADVAVRTRRNAPPAGWRDQLAAWRSELVRLYGWRPDKDASGYLMPYLPVSFADVMLGGFRSESQRWITSRAVPVEAIQSEFIRGKLDAATDALGRWDGDRLVVSESAIEPAPAHVLSQAQPELAPGLGRRPADPSVMRVANTSQLLDNLRRLATHFDLLSGQPSKLEIAGEAVGETFAAVPRVLKSGLAAVADAAEVAVNRVVDIVVPDALEPKKLLAALTPVLIAGAAGVALFFAARR